MVKVLVDDGKEGGRIYREVVAKVREFYGADRAQMTCLVFDYSGRHLHFIDGADGGLSMAAKALKERVAKLG